VSGARLARAIAAYLSTGLFWCVTPDGVIVEMSADDFARLDGAGHLSYLDTLAFFSLDDANRCAERIRAKG